MKQVKVNTGATDAYGTRPTDRDISLGRSDAFNLSAVYDSQDTSTDAAAPTLNNWDNYRNIYQRRSNYWRSKWCYR